MDRYKIGYSFNKATGEFIGEEIVYVELATGRYPCADNVVFIEPPVVEENQVQVWTGKKWKIVDDYRGKAFYSQTGEELGIIEDIDIGPDKVILKKPPVVSDYYRVLWNGHDWDSILKEGYTLGEDGNPREMTQAEKVIAGLENLPENMKIVGTDLVDKTRDELFEEGKLTVEEYNADVDLERANRYKRETDKMGLMYLRGECTLDEWKAAMDKIREELPKK